ncbi:MAG: hypothetical protein WD231_04985 [Candidatus Woykebacteria bacterium]
MRGSALISLLAAVFILVLLIVTFNFLLPKYFPLGILNSNNSSSVTSPIDKANVLSDQANLTAVETSLQVYFSENGRYPNSLDELRESGQLQVDTSKYTYQTCEVEGTKVIIFSISSNQGILLNAGTRTATSPNTC